MPNKLNNWERIECVIRWTNLTINAFAKHIGLPRAENLYQIKRGNNGISGRLADRIAETFPQISRTWLLTGDGTMFVGYGERSVAVPYYDEDICLTAGAFDGLEPACDIVLPDFARCDLAVRCGDGGGDGEVTLLLLRRCGGEESPAAGEYLMLDGVQGRLCRIDEGPHDDELKRTLFGEVTGRIVIKRSCG